MRFPLIRADVPDSEQWIHLLSEPYKAKHFSNSGILWKDLNKKVIQTSGCVSAAGVANNTVGQIAALHAIDIHKKMVIISNFTFPATLQAVIMAGGIPVLCDADEETWELSRDSVVRAISEFGKPKAVIITRVFGQRNKHLELIKYLEEESIDLLFDSAAAFPISKIDPSMQKLIEVYSLHATKAFGIGEGGIVTGPKAFIDKVWNHANFGFLENLNFLDGNNAKMDEFAAARAIAAIASLSEKSTKRKEFVQMTYGGIFDLSDIGQIDPTADQLWSLFPIKFENSDLLEKFYEQLLTCEIMTKKYYSPSMSQGYKGNAEVKRIAHLTISENLAQTVLCLPVYSQFTAEEVSYIRTCLIKAKEKFLE